MISKILAAIGNSKTGQRFYNWAAQPKSETFLNNTLPTIETAFSTACYMISTARQKNIDSDRKKMLQIQHVASGVAGMTVGSIANRGISKYTNKVIEHLDPKKIDPNSIKQISTGLRVITPILTTAFIMRFATPVIISMFSGKAMDKVREKRNKNNVNPIRKQYDEHLQKMSNVNKLDTKA